jgi:hypothetical protein
MSNHRRGPGYRQWVAQVMATCEPVCIRCHMPVDMTLPRNSKWGASADHEPALVLTGDMLPSMDGAGISTSTATASTDRTSRRNSQPPNPQPVL